MKRLRYIGAAVGRGLGNPRLLAMLAADGVLFALALVAAYAIRFDGVPPSPHFARMIDLLPRFVPLQWIVFALLGQYRGMWRYTGLLEIVRLLQATVLGVMLLTALLLFARWGPYPRSVLLMAGILSFLFTGGLRVAIRVRFAGRARRAGAPVSWLPWRRPAAASRVAIIGAGDAGEALARDILARMAEVYEIARFLDDDPRKHGRTLHGIPVHGPIDSLPDLIASHRVDEVLIAIPSATGAQLRHIVGICEAAGVRFKTLPGIDEILDGRVTIQSLREVDYEDLLGRQPVDLDTEGIAGSLRGHAVLVTGAGGSIGAELCRQVLRFDPSRLLLLEANEFNLYRIEAELAPAAPAGCCVPVLGRVQDEALVRHVLREHRPTVIFHAAACKHVPMLEANPWEAVFSNVVGSRVMMDEAEAGGVARFVLVSTDKAVCPANVMGASKRLAERVLLSRGRGRCRFMAVRFGNVVGSSGSVIPLFHEQIRRGGPVTVTHPDIARYFMTIPEAAQLILQAGVLGEGGEVFVLDMGQQIRILDMARDMIRLAGKEPDRDILIRMIGLRPGEKMREQLWRDGEEVRATDHPKIRRIVGPDGEGVSPAALQPLIEAAGCMDGQAIRAALQDLVPECTVGP